MSGSDSNILRRKIEAAALRQAKAALQISLVRDIEKATAKVFLDLLEIEVSAEVSERTISSHIQTIEALSSRLFGIVAFGDDVGLTGFDSHFINTAITQLAGGVPGRSVERPVTSTDAAIFEMIINKILSSVFDAPEVEDADIRMNGYELDKAPLMFLLAEKKYALLRVKIRNVENAELGRFELVIPITCMEKISAMEHRNAALEENEKWNATMSQFAKDTPIELNTVVSRMDISLGKIMDMKKGDMLDLLNGSLTKLSLEGQTHSGPKTIFVGHLGALKTHKAFKITRIPDEEAVVF